MISKNDIKEIKSLSQKKFRDQLGLFTVEGEKLVAEALSSGYEVIRIFRTAEIGLEVMSRISSLTTPSPVLAVVRKPSDDGGIPVLTGLNLALDSIRDPGNLGTIIRLADWFGINRILASKDTVDIYNPKVVQATMGAIFRVKFHYCDLAKTIAGAEMPVYGTFLEGDNIYTAPLTNDGIIVMGSERDGISDEVSAEITQKLFIPPYPQNAHTSESLNVAIATAITCSEFRRRQG